jgi:oxazoline/thiazoline synthase
MEPLELTRVLVFRPNLNVERLGSDALLFCGERERAVLTSRHVGDLCALIDGQRSIEDIVAAVGDSIPETHALFMLHQLVARGYLVGVRSDVPESDLAYWYDVGLDATRALETLGRISVAVSSLGDPGLAELLGQALQENGLRVSSASPLELVLVDDFLREELSELNREARSSGRTWCLVKVVGTRPLIGPIFVPNAGPCWECLAFWIRRNRPVDEFLARIRHGNASSSPPRSELKASVRAAIGFSALAITRALAAIAQGHEHPLHGRLLSLDLKTFETTSHRVVPRPQCSACGDVTRTAILGQQPIALQPVAKNFCEDGGFRRQSPRKTFQQYEHLVSPITGAVSYVVPISKHDSELHAVFASSYLVCPRDDATRANAFDKVCAGKGRTAEQARTSALCEALERFSGVYQGDEAKVRASRSELGSAAIAPEELLNFSDAQYAAPAGRSAARGDVRNWVPRRLDPGHPIDWSPAWSLTHDARRYVPLAYCYAEAVPQSGVEFCSFSGNGVAAGTSKEEAILQGLLELVERDAAAVWWYNRIPRPSVDLASLRDDWLDAIVGDYRRRGFEVWVLDLTHDLGTVVCAAVARRMADGAVYLGFGCHLQPRLAIQRAVTELNQIFELSASHPPPFRWAGLADLAHLEPRGTALDVRSLPAFDGEDLAADVRHCVERLKRAGIDVLAVNKTRPDIGLSVFQVIAPGLRHFWPRFGPGRLYRVPYDLGWLSAPLLETELNPTPLFL